MGWYTILQENFEFVFFQLMKYEVLLYTRINGPCHNSLTKREGRCLDQNRTLLYLPLYKRCPCGTVPTKILSLSSPFLFVSLYYVLRLWKYNTLKHHTYFACTWTSETEIMLKNSIMEYFQSTMSIKYHLWKETIIFILER